MKRYLRYGTKTANKFVRKFFQSSNKKYEFRHTTVKAPKGYYIWSAQPRDGDQRFAEIEFYKNRVTK